MRRFIYGLCFVLLCAGAAYAQTASLSGTVTDPTGAVVPQASVELRAQATGVKMETESNAAGVYTFPFVKPGVYAVTVQKSGFKTLTQTGVTLTVAQNARINFALQVGAATQTVNVTGGAIHVNTTNAAVSTIVDQQFVQNMPLNGRSFQALLLLAPGVNLNAGAGPSNVSGNTFAQGQIVVNGQRGDANYWMVDGVSGNVGVSTVNGGNGLGGTIGATNLLGGTNALVSIGDMQEFRIQTSSYAPEYGRAMGGQISIITRSGTDQFHGSAFDYLRNTSLDAKDWFADSQGLPKAPEIQNDFGGTIGGPIKKNKAFFFFSYEGLRVRQPVTYLGTVPDLASRQAAISAVQPFLNAFPLPKPGAVDVGPGYAPYSAVWSNPGSADAYSLRIDDQLTNKLSLFGRYSYAPSNLHQRFQAEVLHFNETTKTFTVGSTWMVSPNIVDEARFNYSTSGGGTTIGLDNFGGAVPYNTNELFVPGNTLQNSSYALVGLFGTNIALESGYFGGFFQHQYNAVDSLSVQRGKHSLKFGVNYLRLTPLESLYHEQNIPLFLSMAQWEAGQSLENIVVTQIPVQFLFRDLGLYAQDSWHVSPRLSLTYGLRWDIDFVPGTVRGPNVTGLTGFSTTDLSNLALGAPGTPPFSTRYGNTAPRIGAAYELRKNPNWGLVLRSGFGVFYGTEDSEFGSATFIDDLYPWGSAAFPLNLPFPSAPAVPPIEPPNAQNGYILFGFDPHLNVPYSLEWNVALEQSLGRAQTLTASYVGASDKRLLLTESITNPNPNFASTNLVGDAGTSSYNALQLQYQRRMAKGVQALLGYTWSHCIDDGSYGAYANGSLASPNVNRGDCDYDYRHVFSAAVSYDLPAWKRDFFTRALTSGWATNNIVQLRTGPPVDITDANFTALEKSNAAVLIRPDVVPGQPLYLAGPQYPGGKALNPAAFMNPPVDPVTGLPIRQGDLARNSLRALGLSEWDFGVSRDFPIHENIKLQFRADMFNVLNHPNFGAFNNSFLTGNTLFGQATSMLSTALSPAEGAGQQNPLYTQGGPRAVELALKLIF